MIPQETPSTASSPPPDRYGPPPRVPKGWLIVAALVVAAVVGWAGWGVFQALNPPVKAGMVGWTSPVDGEMTATIEIRRAAGVTVTCDVIAVDDRLAEVGRATVTVPADDRRHLRATTTIPVEGNAIAAELRGCTATS